MADFEYVDVNGRQIRVRPRETAQEIDEYGNFHRQPNRFTEAFGEGKNPVEKDRYILFWAKGCKPLSETYVRWSAAEGCNRKSTCDGAKAFASG